MERRIERFDKYMKSKGLNDNKVTNQLGLSVGTLGKSRKESRDLSDKNIELILNFYTDINRVWLLTGEGEMINHQNRNGVVSINQSQIHENKKGTPVFDIDVTCGKEFRDLRDERVIGYVDLPIIRNDSYIVTATGDSMSPKVLSGDFIVIREIKNRDYFLWGHMYLVVTPEYRMLKYIEKHPTDQKEHIVLRSENEAYSDIELPIKDIFKLFVVENIISINNL